MSACIRPPTLVLRTLCFTLACIRPRCAAPLRSPRMKPRTHTRARMHTLLSYASTLHTCTRTCTRGGSARSGRALAWETWPTLAGGLIGPPPRIRGQPARIKWIVCAGLKVHKLFDRKYKKNLKRLLIVHPSWTAQPRLSLLRSQLDTACRVASVGPAARCARRFGSALPVGLGFRS